MEPIKKYVRTLLKKSNELVSLYNWSNDINNPVVSIHCFVFNQEKYISRCLDSLINQLVNFGVEILVHDDCSKDNSKKIIREYCAKYPKIIKPIFEETNVYSKTGNFLEIAEILNKKSKGKYIAICEGDDYWTDPLKLFLQVSILEKYTECHFCVHRVNVSSANDDYQLQEKRIPSFKMSTCFLDDVNFISLIHDGYNFQTSSYFFRKIDYNMLFNLKPLYMTLMPTDDEVLLRHFGSLGKTCFIDRNMSVYLQFTTGSWSKEHKDGKDSDKRNRFLRAVVEFDNYSNGKYSKSCKKIIIKEKVFSLIESKQYKAIFCDKELRKALRKIDFRTYLSLRLRLMLGKI